MNSATIRTCERAGAVLGVLAVATSLALGQPMGTTLGVALGAGLALLNLIVIRKLVGRALGAIAGQGEASRGGARWAIVFVLKLAIVVGVIWAATHLGGATPMSIMVGVSAVFLSVIVVSLLMGGSSADATPNTTADPTP